MTAALVSCPKCGRGNFLPAGLARHVCRAPAQQHEGSETMSKKPKDAPEPAAETPAKPAPASAEVVWREAKELKPHPMFTKIRQPMMAEDGQEWASFVEDVRASGIREPVIINAKNEVMDGRHRAKAAKEAGVRVPCLVRADDEAALIIAGSLAHRRHYTKSGLAYVLHPFAEEYRAAGLEARTANFTNVSPKTRKMGDRDIRVGHTLEQFAVETGLGLETLRMAKDVHGQLDKVGAEKAPDPETGMADRTVREITEAMLFERGIGLGGVLKWLGSLAEDAKGNFKKGMAHRNDYALQLTKHFTVLPKHFAHWTKIPEGKRKELLVQVQTWTAQWPDDFAEAAMKGLVATLRERKAG